MFICLQEINFISNFFFDILLRHCKLDILGILIMLDHSNQNYSIKLWQTFMLKCMQKNQLQPSFFSRYCKEIPNLLFWVIWAFLTTQRESDSIGLRKTLTFMCWHKINFIFHLFLGILQKS